MWRKFWRRLLIVCASIVLIWLIFVAGLVFAIHFTGQQQNAEDADVIIVLGAGLNRNGSPGGALRRRSYIAAELWHEGYADTIICTGGQTQYQWRSEAEGCQEVLLREGVAAAAIVLENQSRSTEENAIYSHEIMQANNWNTAIIVSDSFHMLRARFIFTSRGHDVVIHGVPSAWLRKSYYVYQLGREVLALHWQVFKDSLNLPITYVP